MAGRRTNRGVAILSASIVAVSGSIVALAATGKSGSPPTPKGWVTVTPAAKGALASVTWDLPYGEPTSVDPTQSAAQSENAPLANMCESLLQMTPQFGYAPGLATSYSHPTPTKWVYNIRQGVKFWDGKLLTPDDVAYSLNRNLDSKVGSFWNDPFFVNVEKISKTGPNQVTVALSHPDAVFNEMMATAPGAIGEASYIKTKGKAYGTAKGGLMCTGPYEFHRWTPGVSLILIKNPHYWNASLRPKVQQVKFVFLTNPATITNGLLSGELDGTYEAPISAVPKLQHSTVGKLYLGLSTEYGNLSFTNKPGPIENPKIRRALALMIDRQAIASKILQGTAVPVYSLAYPSTWGYATSTFRQGYSAMAKSEATDVAEAKRLVREAGSPKRTMSMLVNADDPAATQTALYLQSVAQQIGLNIKLVQVPGSQLLAIAFNPKARIAYDIMLQYTGYFDIPEPLEQALFSLKPGALFNYLNYSNKTVGNEIKQANGTANAEKRALLVNRIMAQAIGHDEAQVPFVNYAERLFMNNRVTGAPAGMPVYLYYPWAARLGSPK